MLNEADIINIASTYLDAYRGVLVIDPLLRFSVRTVGSGPVAETIKDANSKLSWILQLNANQHSTIEDVRDSAIEFLANIMLVDMDLLESDLVKDIKERISCRLFCALQNMLPDLADEEE
jgi:hypothetical protein